MNEKTFPCVTCGKYFTDERAWKIHANLKHHQRHRTRSIRSVYISDRHFSILAKLAKQHGCGVGAIIESLLDTTETEP